MAERWLRRAGATTQFHLFRTYAANFGRSEALISCCGMLRMEGRMEGPEGFPQYFCRRCTDIKAAENRRKGETP